LIAQLLGVTVSEATVRRLTQRIGTAAAAAVERQQRRLEKEAPPPPAGPDQLLVSTDGAMVPLVGGEWAEVRTLVVGRLEPPVAKRGKESRIPCTELSYFSRLLSSDEFLRAAYPEIFRRGVETAGAVAAVNDGAEWCQTFVQFHRPDARRILDFPHAAQRVAEAARLCLGEGPPTAEWLTPALSNLKRAGPDAILQQLAGWAAQHLEQPKVRENLEYLRKRKEQMDYAGHREAGCPIASGCVESANKLVVEARLKGPGMHWARRNVNPMLALRNGECSGRWDELWLEAGRELQRRKPADPETLRLPPTALPSPVPTDAKEPTPPPARQLRAARSHPWRQHNPGWLSGRSSTPAARK
jgi:hypothetical protein